MPVTPIEAMTPEEPDSLKAWDGMTCEELRAVNEGLGELLQRDIDDYDERIALRYEHIDTSDAATTQRAVDALQRPERFAGEHEVARAWLRNYAPHAGIFRRERT